MKKIVLSLAGVLAATAFAPEASALPAFARQTGMACNACHQTHFPVLNEFGRAFKALGYTLMGAQGRVEGENLSIPDTLNGAVLLKYRYQKQVGKAPVAGGGQTAATNTGNGMWQMGDEFSLFFAGRVAETELFNVGFLMENNVAAAGALLAGLRLPITTDLGAVKLQVVPFATDALGVTYSYELSSGGVARANRWNEMRRNISAVQYNADQGADLGAASGFAFVTQNDLFFVNYTKWSSSFAPGANGGAVPSTNYAQTYVRAAVTPTIGDFAILAGVGRESGASYSNAALGTVESKQTFVDFQAQGMIGEMESGLYAQYANAPACTGVLATNCAHNKGTLSRKAFTLGGEFTVVPHTLIASLAYRNGKTGTLNAVTGSSHTDNAVNVGAIYELTQNVELHLNYAKYSGTLASAVGGIRWEWLGMLEAAW
jgi:hypothetical protein